MTLATRRRLTIPMQSGRKGTAAWRLAGLSSLVDVIDYYSMPEPNSGCLLWLGPTTCDGYAGLTWHGKNYRVHRLNWMLAHGDVPDGLYVCHRCDVPLCINPVHLFLGTALDNLQDLIAKGRHAHATARGEQAASAKLTEAQVRLIRSATGSQPRIAARFGVSRTTVGEIQRGETWGHLQ